MRSQIIVLTGLLTLACSSERKATVVSQGAADATPSAPAAPTAKAEAPAPPPPKVDGSAGTATQPAASAGECKSDGDCTIVDEDCCNCSAGGKRIALLRSRAAAHKAKLKCDDIACITVISDDPSCGPKARAACAQGRCALRF